eukprot:gnl/MRDRNA2_/MRDRNA2_81870_c0_seq1.p1 gnl/MRDRNA2_/MRDRNA2_81870_c0~~gnl/MRDRNA2_/MRDRNA2_81870_c0_seq1.p1  ORF type:complete len:588 (-),score=71.80 gnl/MRDRNA2_/MRDRNA2_81870_c0_seq1:301-2064(-)
MHTNIFRRNQISPGIDRAGTLELYSTWIPVPTAEAPEGNNKENGSDRGDFSARSWLRMTPRSNQSESSEIEVGEIDEEFRGTATTTPCEACTPDFATPRSVCSSSVTRMSRTLSRPESEGTVCDTVCDPVGAPTGMIGKFSKRGSEQLCKRLACTGIVVFILSSITVYIWFTFDQHVAWFRNGSRPPVILIPGLASSALEFKLTDADVPNHRWCRNSYDWSLGWVDPTQLIPGAKDCLMANLQLFYDAEEDKYSNREGVQLRPVDFGGVEGVYELDPLHTMITLPIYKPIIDRLKREGYRVGENLHGAPYDWRLAGDAHSHDRNGIGGLYPNLTRLIEDTYERNKAPVVLISHSLGGILVLHYLHTFVSETWRRQHIAGWFSVNGVFGGTSMILRMFATGIKFGLPVVPLDYFKSIETGCPSGIWMLPSSRVYGETIVVETPTKKYRANDWMTILRDFNNTQLMKIAKKFARMELLPDTWWQKFVPDVPTHFVVTHGIQTEFSYTFDSSFVEGFNERPASTEYVDGDGTVPWISLVSYRKWEGAQLSIPWSEEILSKVDHRHSIIDERVSSSIVKFIQQLSSGSLNN